MMGYGFICPRHDMLYFDPGATDTTSPEGRTIYRMRPDIEAFSRRLNTVQCPVRGCNLYMEGSTCDADLDINELSNPNLSWMRSQVQLEPGEGLLLTVRPDWPEGVECADSAQVQEEDQYRSESPGGQDQEQAWTQGGQAQASGAGSEHHALVEHQLAAAISLGKLLQDITAHSYTDVYIDDIALAWAERWIR